MEALFLSVVFFLTVASAIVLFFLVIRCYKNLSPLEGPEKKFAKNKATLCFIASIALCALFFIFFPSSPLWRAVTRGPDIKYYLYAAPSALVCIVVTAVLGVKYAKLAGLSGWWLLLQKVVVVIGQFGFAAHVFGLFAGMGWGRPLRVAGKILKPALQTGNEWAQGERPQADQLDNATRKALEALWLHDAKKEYASVPAFSRLGWQLAALAAPPELLRDVHIAALQEIEHARKCFALAAGFGSEAQTVLPMLEMLNDPGDLSGNPFLHIAIDSLIDGCLLEGFNADVAHRSIEICLDPVSLKVIKQIAREERSHAELSWRIVEFCFRQSPQTVGQALRKERVKLQTFSRPTASSSQNLPLLKAANPAALIQYGRLPDVEFDAIWRDRIRETEEQLLLLLENGAENPALFSLTHKNIHRPRQSLAAF